MVYSGSIIQALILFVCILSLFGLVRYTGLMKYITGWTVGVALSIMTVILLSWWLKQSPPPSPDGYIPAIAELERQILQEEMQIFH